MEILGEVVTAFLEHSWPSPPVFLLDIRVGGWSDAEGRTCGGLCRVSALRSGYLAEILKMVLGGVVRTWGLPPLYQFPISFVDRVSVHSSGGADQRG